MTSLIRTSLLALLVSLPAWSAPRDEEQYGRLPDSVRRIEQETGGKVLQVKLIQRGDREIYRMKVLTPEGRIKVVHDDPRHSRDIEPTSGDLDTADAGSAQDLDRDHRNQDM